MRPPSPRTPCRLPLFLFPATLWPSSFPLLSLYFGRVSIEVTCLSIPLQPCLPPCTRAVISLGAPISTDLLGVAEGEGMPQNVSVSHCLEAGPAKAWAHSCTDSPRGRTSWGSWACEALGKGIGLEGAAWASEISAQLERFPKAFSLEGTLSSLSLFLDLGLELRVGPCAQGWTHQSTREGDCLGMSQGLLSVPSARQQEPGVWGVGMSLSSTIVL